MANPISFSVSSTASAANAIQPLDGFISYSIEFSSFPDFAGKTVSLYDHKLII